MGIQYTLYNVSMSVYTYMHIYLYIYMGGCQNYGPFWGTLNNRSRIIIGTQKGTIILTTTHMYRYVCPSVSPSVCRSVCPSVCPSVRGSVGLCMYVCMDGWICIIIYMYTQA